MLRQLEAILAIHKLACSGNHLDALREIARLPFLPLDPRSADFSSDVFNNISPHVEACVPGLLKDALNCLDNVTDTDGSLRAMRAKVKTRLIFFFTCFCNHVCHLNGKILLLFFADSKLSCKQPEQELAARFVRKDRSKLVKFSMRITVHFFSIASLNRLLCEVNGDFIFEK